MDKRFLKGETWGYPGATVEHIETHAADVFLVAGKAFKIKKAVKLPYLDFSTVEKRRQVLAHELAVNRLYAPAIYRGVIEIDGEPVLEMERFDGQAILARTIERGGISDGVAIALAKTAAEAHAIAPRAEVSGSAIMAGLGAQLSKAFTSSPDIFRSAETIEFHALYEEALHRLKPLLNFRGEKGLVRRCHGDMHCGNIVVVEGAPVLFDAIEFSEKIATIDVLYDLAFLLMDLDKRGALRAANLVLNQYLHLRRGTEDLSGLAALPLFMSTRAGVRALVTADLVHELAVQQSLKPRGEALDYFRASLAFLKPAPARLICIGGLSGTGKSALAASLAPEIGAAPGALHLRSDVERKALAGVPYTERLPESAYGAAASERVYAAMLARAEAALAADHAVVLDAVFARDGERRAAEALARRCHVDFRGLWLEAPADVLRRRVSQRTGDASDATAGVVRHQLAYDLGEMTWSRVDASGEPADILRKVRRILPSPLAVPA